MKNERECGYTGKARFTADEIKKEIKSVRKAAVTSFLCKCQSFHLVIRRRKRDALERSDSKG